MAIQVIEKGPWVKEIKRTPFPELTMKYGSFTL